MKTDFALAQLGPLTLKIGSGATPRGGSGVYLEEGVALIRSQNVHNNEFVAAGLAFVGPIHAEQLGNVEVKAQDVLLNITGDSVARACMVPEDVLPARVNQHVAIIRTDASKLDSKFLKYVLVSPQMQQKMISLAGTGATRNALTKGMIEQFDIPLPPLVEQKRIAHILGTLDDKIELNRRMNATLEAMARALFKSWFVDFDPVRAKAAGRDPGLPATIAALFPAAFVESELGEVPEGWGVGRVGESFNVTMGQSPPGSTYNESAEGLPFYQGRADFDSRYPNRRVYCTAPTRFAQEGDSLVSVRAPVGSLNMAGEECAIGRGLAAVRHKSGSRSFTYYSMQSMESSFALFEAEGTVFGSINKDAFAGLAAVTPPTVVVSAFESVAYPLDERILLNTQQTGTLAALRDTLLPRLLSGEVRVDVIERKAQQL